MTRPRILLASVLLVLVPAPGLLAFISLNSLSFPDPAALQEYLSYHPERLPLISAHRAGYTREVPENSLAAAKQTLERTPAILEVDVRQTFDEVLVLMHDETVDRTTNGSGRVDEITWSELRLLRLVAADGAVTDETVPRLDEFLAWSRSRAIVFLDIKRGVPYDAVVQTVRAARARSAVVLIAYTEEAVAAMAPLDPDLMISAPGYDVDQVERLLSMIANPARLVFFTGTRQPDSAVLARIHEAGRAAVHGAMRHYDRLARFKGVEAYDPLFVHGVDIIATNEVGLLVEALAETREEVEQADVSP